MKLTKVSIVKYIHTLQAIISTRRGGPGFRVGRDVMISTEIWSSCQLYALANQRAHLDKQ